MEKILLELFRLIAKYYYRIQGLLLGYALIGTSILLIIENKTDRFVPVRFRITIYAFMCAAWTLIWFISRNYLPKASKGKLGLFVCINAEDEKQKIRIKFDFSDGLNKLLSASNINPSFDVIVLNDFQASRVTATINGLSDAQRIIRENKGVWPDQKKPIGVKRWEKLILKTNGKLFIWGTIKERKDQENKYILNLDAAVTHKHVELTISDKVKKDFIAVFPKEIQFYEKMEFQGFTITTELIYVVTKYIVGIAALISGDPLLALKLHYGLKEEMEKLSNQFSQQHLGIIYAINKVDELIMEEKNWIARYEYSTGNLAKAKQIISECLKAPGDKYSSLLMLSIISFAHDKDPLAALTCIKNARQYSKNNFVWLYNKAFILMYLGRYEKGIKDYKKLAALSFPGEDQTVDECIAFNKSLLENEPDKMQCLFILGFLFYKKKGNYPMAMDYFEKFISRSTGEQSFTHLREAASSYLSDIKKGMVLKD